MLTRAISAAGLFRRGKLGRLEKLVAYGATRTAAEGLLALRQLALAGILGPTLFGAWALFRILMSFYPFAGLGTARALEVEVSRAAAGTTAADAAVHQAAWGRALLGFMLAVFVPVTAITAAAAAWLPDGPVAMALGGVALTILLDRLWTYAFTYLRAIGHLRRFAVVETMNALFQALLTTTLAFVWGLEGAFLGFLLASAVGVSMIARSVPRRPTLPPARVGRLIGLGLPLCLTQILTTGLVTADRLVVGALAGIDDLGRYAFAVSLASLGMAGASVIRAVIFPEVYGSAAASGVARTTLAHLESTLRPFAILLPPLAGLGALALGPIVGWVMPRYADTVLVAQLFVFAGLAQGLATLTTLGIVAADRQRILPLLSLGALLLTALVSVVALKAGLGLTGVAAGALIGRTAGAAGLIHRLMCIAGLRSPLRTSLGIICPLAWCGAAVAVVGYGVPATDPGKFVLACALYVLLVAPLALLARTAWAGARRGTAVL